MKNEKLTPKERMEAEAKIAALRAEANALSRALKKDGATDVVEETPVETTEVVEEVPVEETPVETTEVVEEVPVEETPVETTEVVEEVPVEETPVETTEVVEEVPVEETPVETTEVVEEVPVEETPVETTEVVEEVPVEETPVETTGVVEEAPVEETPVETTEVVEEVPVEETPVETTEVVEEVPVEETPVETTEVVEEVPVEETPAETTGVVEGRIVSTEPIEENNNTRGFVKVLKWLGGIIGVCALVGVLVMLILTHFNGNNGTNDPDSGTVDPTPGETVVTVNMDAFIASTVNIAKTLTTDKDVEANINILVEKIGASKIQDLVVKHGEVFVQKVIAEYIAFVPEIKMNQYIKNNSLDYNPNAMNDWYDKLDEATKAYTEATGKNPEGAFMSLEGYDTYKNNREAMKALIIESGDTALLTWYEAKTTGYDVMVQQRRDTEAADGYKEAIEFEIITNVNGSIKLIELQLEKNIDGAYSDIPEYREEYAEFIINNYYVYVVAN